MDDASALPMDLVHLYRSVFLRDFMADFAVQLTVACPIEYQGTVSWRPAVVGLFEAGPDALILDQYKVGFRWELPASESKPHAIGVIDP